MSFLLEADTCVARLRRNAVVANRFLQHAGGLFLSVVSVTGLELWLLRPNTPSRFQAPYMGLRSCLTLLNVDDAVAHRAARVGNSRPTQARRLTTADLLIAATALEHGLTLVTHHTAAYAGIPGLTVVDWLAP